MKVYSGTRVFDRESMPRGEASVVVQNVVGDGPAGCGRTSESNPSTGSGHRLRDRRPLTHVSYHSPDGFEWGYAGSGPADLALAILADYFEEPAEFVLAALRSMWTPRSKAAALHQSFKERFVAIEHRDEWQLHSDDIEAWLQTPANQTRLAELAQEEDELAEIRRLEEEVERAHAGAAD
jgi:hypothetical protein